MKLVVPSRPTSNLATAQQKVMRYISMLEGVRALPVSVTRKRPATDLPQTGFGTEPASRVVSLSYTKIPTHATCLLNEGHTCREGGIHHAPTVNVLTPSVPAPPSL